MMASTGKTRLRQVVGSFHEAGDLQAVVQAFVDQGVAASDLTILVGQMPLDEKFLPHMRGNLDTMLDNALSAMSVIGMTDGAGALLVSSTPFGDLLVAAAADTAGTSRPLLTHWLSTRHAGYLHQQLNAGAALLCSALHPCAQWRRGKASGQSASAAQSTPGANARLLLS